MRYQRDSIVFLPYILKSMTEICKHFGVGSKMVRTWAKSGAPIAVEGVGARKRYSAEALRVQTWRETRHSDVVEVVDAVSGVREDLHEQQTA